MNQLRPEAFIDLGTQTTDMGFNDVRARVEMNVPDMFKQHCARDHLTGVPHQVFQQLEFSWLQLNQLSATPHRAGQEIKLQIEDVQLGLHCSRARPSPQRSNPRDKLRKGERLHQIIITARVQARDTVLNTAERCQEQNRRLMACHSQTLDQVQSIKPRDHAIDN